MKISSRYLAGGAGALLLAAQIAYTSGWEGRVRVPYRDVGGVLTVCDGHTGPDIIPGKTYSDAECDALHRKDQLRIEASLLKCAPELARVPDEIYIAVNDWAFNVGADAACRSTLIRKLRAGDLKGACEQFSRWVFVNGEVVRGLQNRRVNGLPGLISNRSLCRKGLA